MHPRLQQFPFDVQYMIVLFKYNVCTHTYSHTHSLQITSAREDYEYYWNKNTHFFFFSDNDYHSVLGAVLDLTLPIVFHVQEAFRRLYVQKTGIRDSHGAVTLPLGI